MVRYEHSVVVAVCKQSLVMACRAGLSRHSAIGAAAEALAKAEAYFIFHLSSFIIIFGKWCCIAAFGKIY